MLDQLRQDRVVRGQVASLGIAGQRRKRAQARCHSGVHRKPARHVATLPDTLMRALMGVLRWASSVRGRTLFCLLFLLALEHLRDLLVLQRHLHEAVLALVPGARSASPEDRPRSASWASRASGRARLPPPPLEQYKATGNGSMQQFHGGLLFVRSENFGATANVPLLLEMRDLTL